MNDDRLIQRYNLAQEKLGEMASQIFNHSGRSPYIDGLVLELGQDIINTCFTAEELTIISNTIQKNEQQRQPK